MSEKDVSANFLGQRVAAFESRQAGEIGRMIERFGGVPLVSPSVREVAIDPNPQAVDFAHRLITGQIDIVVFLTGVGFRTLLSSVERSIDRQRFLDALADVMTVARGPKPVAAMKEVGLTPTIKVPEPNTWRELLMTLDARPSIANLNIAIQEYGKPNPSLVAGLEARGATVVTIPVYRWELPEDCGPLLQNIHEIVCGNVDVVMFTSASQILNLMTIAERETVDKELRRRLGRMIVASVGPTTSDTLRDLEIRVDVEPEHPKMGSLVMAAAQFVATVNQRPGSFHAGNSVVTSDSLLDQSQNSTLKLDPLAPWYDSPFLRACRREPNSVTPVWLMRQAGRYMAEYRAVREKTSFLELCKNPQLCSEVMVTAVHRLGVDAAIIFSDLLPILEPLGFHLEFAPGDGPIIHNPIRDFRDVERVRELEDLDSLWFVIETVRQTRADLSPKLPLIGFSGSPFTLASYAIEGGASRNFLKTKQLMYGDNGAWNALMERLSRAIVLYLKGQISAGAQCVQLFDSWVGCLGTDDYRKYVLPHMRWIIGNLPAQIPIINFATGNPALLPCIAEADLQESNQSSTGVAAQHSSDVPAPPRQRCVIGVDWRVRLDDAWRTIGVDRAIQGNLDPAVLLSNIATIRTRVRDVLNQAEGRPGHIFNLGHGILPSTNVDHAIAVVDAVHEFSQSG